MKRDKALIRPTHLERQAVVYVRQSTQQQVLSNVESGRLQYGLRELALEWGWSEGRVETIDEDLGVSGSGTEQRSGFRRLLMKVAQEEVGVVLGLDASRLARNTADWFELLRWLRLTDTLVAKDGRVYDLKESDSRLVLGIEGTLSEEDLFRIQGRLRQGRMNKAARGELYSQVPPGFQLRGKELVKDPDERVRKAIEAVFARFEEAGSARQAAKRLQAEGQKLPGGSRGEEWKPATYRRVLQLLRNPAMGGMYVYGRTQTKVRVEEPGKVRKVVVQVPREEWLVELGEHHEGYVTRQHWEAVQKRLRDNSSAQGRGAAREGRALLQGLAVCARCGRGMHVKYGSSARYLCPGKDSGLARAGCFSVSGARVDQWVSGRFLEAAGNGGVQAALRAESVLQERETGRLRGYELELEQRTYRAALAERRYKAEDPDNRLVMRSLGAEWEAALAAQESARTELERAREAQQPGLRQGKAVEVLAELGADVRALWESAHVDARDRKRLLATLVDEVLLEVDREAGLIEVLLRWKGGLVERAQLPKPRTGTPSGYDEGTVDLVRRLAALKPDREIAEQLNAQGKRTPRGQVFTRSVVQKLRVRNGIVGTPAARRRRPKEGPLLGVRDAAKELGTTKGTLYRWIREGLVSVEEPAKVGAGMRVRLTAQLRERFCESCPEGYVPAAQARRAMGVSRQRQWQQICEGALEAKQIVRGSEKGLYVKWDDQPSQERLPFEPSEEDDGVEP